MIFLDDRGHETASQIPSGRRISGDPQFPIHHVLNMRERSMRIPAEEFSDWIALTGIEMIQFYNENEDVRNTVVQSYSDAQMTCNDVVAWLQEIQKDTITPSDLSYGFRTHADCMAFKMRWF